MEINSTEFTKLMSEVEKEFGDFLAKAEKTTESAPEVQVLSKSEEGEPKKEEPKKEEEKKDAPPESKPEEKKDEKSAPEKKDESPEQKPEDKPEQKPEGEDGEGHGYDEEDMKHMHEMYGSMNKHELKAHHDAVKMALDKCMGMVKDEPEMQMSEAAPAMVKSEIELNIPAVTPELELVKSELAAEKAKSEELKKSFDLVTQILNKLVKKTAPQGKAITSMETIAKSETTPAGNEIALSDKQIVEILRRKASDPSLSKSDREAINGFFLSGKSIQTINHLLK